MKIGITSNILKIFAIIIVVIDHTGAYMYQNIDEQTYYILRSIGRMAMPIFSYLLVQGFLYTKNLKKYISLNALHCLFIYGNKTTKKILGNLVNNNKENKNQDFFI